MNLKGTSYLNRIQATLPHLSLTFSEQELLKARLDPKLQELFHKCKPQDDDEKDQLARAYLRAQYLNNPKNKTL